MNTKKIYLPFNFKRFKHFILGIAACTVIFLSHSASIMASTRVEMVEVPISQIFIPSSGFDDNDTIQFVAEGTLPNSCYSLAGQLIQPNDRRDSFTVRQFAYKRTDEQCLDPQLLPDYLQTPIPYTIDGYVGVLPAGTYRLLFKENETNQKRRNFIVAPASSSLIDNNPYAAITNAYLTSGINHDKNIQVLVSGVLTSTCMSITDVLIIKQNDVVILLPKLAHNAATSCQAAYIPFEKTIDIGMLEAGRYLLHTRSMNGRSLNQTFSVF